MTELVAVDVGGTHARFARARIDTDRTIVLEEPVTLRTADYPGFEAAFLAFEHESGPAPRAVAIAAAGPLIGDAIKLTNAPWHLQLGEIRAALQLDAVTALNDFAAVAHAVARVPADQLGYIAGPHEPLPETGTVSVIGPGTGLGVAHFRRSQGGYQVQATEGGHVGFAPQDELDDKILATLRIEHGRVVAERVCAGPGIVPIYRALGGTETLDDKALWAAGLAGNDELATLAIDRFCASLGAVVGDYALAHGASAVVLAGGLGLKLRERLPASQFVERFCAKPRYEAMMAQISVKLIVHPQPGLYGAVAAFQSEHLA